MYDWHKEEIKQTLQALVEREEKEIRNTEFMVDAIYDKAKQDTIQYLQEQIKKL